MKCNGQYILFTFLILLFINNKNAYSGGINDTSKKSIFDNLFEGISDDYKFYIANAEYTVREHYPNDHLQPKKIIIVENEVIQIYYWPDYSNDALEKYVPQIVYIYKKTNKFALGENIGENIDDILALYKEEPRVNRFSHEITPNVFFTYDNGFNNVSFTVLNNVIIRVSYSWYE